MIKKNDEIGQGEGERDGIITEQNLSRETKGSLYIFNC